MKKISIILILVVSIFISSCSSSRVRMPRKISGHRDSPKRTRCASYIYTPKESAIISIEDCVQYSKEQAEVIFL